MSQRQGREILEVLYGGKFSKVAYTNYMEEMNCIILFMQLIRVLGIMLRLSVEVTLSLSLSLPLSLSLCMCVCVCVSHNLLSI